MRLWVHQIDQEKEMSSSLIRLTDGSYLKMVPLENPTGDPTLPIIRLEPVPLRVCPIQHPTADSTEDDPSDHWTVAECMVVAEQAFANDPFLMKAERPRFKKSRWSFILRNLRPSHLWARLKGWPGGYTRIDVTSQVRLTSSESDSSSTQ